MPVLTQSAVGGFTLPVPLEPDIEHLRRHHGNTTASLCFALIGQLKLPSSSSSVLTLSQLNCTLSADSDDDNEEVTWWLQQLALGNDPVYYVLPLVLITGIVCDTFSVSLLARLLLLRTRTSCRGDVTSDVYLLWLTVTSDLWLICIAVRALPDYVTGHVTESLMWADGYAAAVGEWFSYTCLWLLLTMSLNAAVCLSGNSGSFSAKTEEHRQNSENSSNHAHHHHHPHNYQVQQQQQNRCRQLFVCIAIHIVCIVSTLPQFLAYQMVDSLNPADLNRTVLVSQLDDQLTTSFEYSVVYYWYTVCLTVLLPVPLLTAITAVLAASLVRFTRTNSHEKVPVKPTDSVQDPRVTSSACNCKSLDSLRLHIALIVLYLLFTCPRCAMVCIRGVFATSSRHTSASVSTTDTDVIYSMLQSLSELAYSVYQASLLPLLASYHGNFRRLLVNSASSCRHCFCRCCSRSHSAYINSDNNIPIALTTVTTTHGSARKSVKFDMQAVEFEIQY